VSHGCSAEHPNVSRRSAHPSTGVSEAKRQSPDAEMRARERDGLFEMVKNAASDARPHPEERARRRSSTNSNARTRVSKDEDEPAGAPSCFETHRSARWRSLGGLKHQPAAAENDDRRRPAVSRLFFTG